MTALHDDPRVRRGMERQLELRRRILADGARPIGWKLGLGTAAAMEQHGTTAPLVGFLTDRGVREPGSELSIGGWTKATAEPEIAVHLAGDVPTGADPDAVAAAIGGLGVAFEIVDIDGGEVEDILAGDIFHRFVVLGPATPYADGDLADLRGDLRHGDERQAVDDPLALVGDPLDAVAHLADHLAAFGETVRAGEVLITGSIVPALAIAPGDVLRYRVEPLGDIALSFAA
jgi:2-keto-4-pentenoate hydratase